MYQLATNTYGLVSGDANGDGTISWVGSGNDRAPILVSIGGVDVFAIYYGYVDEDLNLDGQVKWVGAGNDRALVLLAIGGVNVFATISQQIP
jgi:hypothetical protein